MSTASSIADRATAYRDGQFRSFDLGSVEVRGADDGSDFTFEGVASVVDTPYEVNDQWGTFTETIRAGAFDKTLAEVTKRASKMGGDVALYVNHRHADVPMASTRAGTLKLSADPNLRAVASLDPIRPDVIIARSAVQRGELSQMSIGFSVPKDTRKDQWNADYTERVISEVRLVEVSIVRQGANPHTEASMRSLDDMLAAITEIDMDEADLRRAIAAFEARLPAPEATAPAADLADIFAERDRQDRERLERLMTLDVPAYL